MEPTLGTYITQFNENVKYFRYFYRASTAKEEPWDAPFQGKSNSTSNSSSTEDSKPSTVNQLPDIPYTRDPTEQIQKLPMSPNPPANSSVPKSLSKLTVTKPKEDESELEAIMNQRNRLISNNSTLANKDFKYIKPPIATPRAPKDNRPNPIAELKMLGRNDNAASEDDPPFNFQKMLRKTNFQRDSLKKAVETFRMYGGEDKEHSNCNGINNGDAYVKFELAPGIVLEGIVADV